MHFYIAQSTFDKEPIFQNGRLKGYSTSHYSKWNSTDVIQENVLAAALKTLQYPSKINFKGSMENVCFSITPKG